MAIGLSALQTVLEEGNKDDWFGSPFIVKLSVIAAIALSAFVAIELTAKKPLLNLGLLVRRNFGFGLLANFLLGIALYGSVFILPVYLSRIQGYNAEQIGLVLAWTGLPQLLLIPLVPRLMQRFDPRLIIGIGFALFAASNFMNRPTPIAAVQNGAFGICFSHSPALRGSNSGSTKNHRNSCTSSGMLREN